MDDGRKVLIVFGFAAGIEGHRDVRPEAGNVDGGVGRSKDSVGRALHCNDASVVATPASSRAFRSLNVLLVR